MSMTTLYVLVIGGSLAHLVVLLNFSNGRKTVTCTKYLTFEIGPPHKVSYCKGYFPSILGLRIYVVLHAVMFNKKKHYCE